MPTIKDVARDSGLGVGTISRYLNNKPVTTENRLKIAQSIKKLGYERNELARGLKTNRSFVIGVLIPDLTDIFATMLVQTIEQIAYNHGYNTITCDSRGNDALEREKIRLLVRRDVDGLIVFPSNDSAANEAYGKLDIPLVLINTNITDSLYDTIRSDDFEAGKQAGNNFYKHGHRRVAIITQMRNRPGYLRAQGFFSEFGPSHDPSLLYDGEFSIDDGYTAMKAIMESENRPTGVFTTNYYTTIGALRYCREAHIEFPEDISFIGFDNIGAIPILGPPITIIEQPIVDIGKQAVSLLLQQIEHPDISTRTPIEMLLKTRLVIAESVKTI
ncbi:LacI family DNA-binding transcriptional regulator [Sphaerochaeta sp. PS]|uniref:LacI family DNA-binding transcriptional regulator n=1 Tax=Sphaerochaeta sp. PS TaxID=3076336 RepID=UPI0028A4CEEA|nr:LacI family DNA-binding transcriptional regulator [Sphaerochaeta sp. PS]MDT4761052.1 LacI family DNA-binding transcriptional regulator [Sphaerochaeta sp. PS]